MIQIERIHLEALVAAASAAVEDLNTGLAEGIYEEDTIGGYLTDTVDEAIARAEELLA